MDEEHQNEIIRWFEDLNSADVSVVGGKNASLGEMIRTLKVENIRVPVEEPPNEPQKPPVEEPGEAPETPPPPGKPPVQEPPNGPPRPPVKEPPPKDPDREPPQNPPMKLLPRSWINYGPCIFRAGPDYVPQIRCAATDI